MALPEKILHVSILAIYIMVTSTLFSNAKLNATSTDPKVKFYSQHSHKFLTKWTYGMQLLCYTSIVLAHFLNVIPGLKKASHKLRGFADFLFTTIVIPVGLVVTTVFWTIYLIDRELIFPRWLDGILPVWLNHAIHTFNSVLPLIDLLSVNHKFSSWRTVIGSTALYLGSYLVCLFETYYTYGLWLYPIFSKLTFPQIACLCLFTYFLAIFFHSVARLLNKIRWGTSLEEPKSKKIKHKTKKVA